MTDAGPLGTQDETLQEISPTEGLFGLPLTDIDDSILISLRGKSRSLWSKWKKQQAINICSPLKENFNDILFAYQMLKVKKKIVNVAEDEVKLTLTSSARE